MAFSQKSDKWYDQGLDIPTEEVEKWNPGQWMLEHVKELAEQCVLLQRRADTTGIDHPVFTAKVARAMWENVRHDTGRLMKTAVNDLFGIGTLAEIDYPDHKSVEGKRQSKAAISIDLREWLVERRLKLTQELTYVVTIWRKLNEIGRLPKSEQSFANKVEWALEREYNKVCSLIEDFDAIPRPAGVPHPEADSVDS